MLYIILLWYSTFIYNILCCEYIINCITKWEIYYPNHKNCIMACTSNFQNKVSVSKKKKVILTHSVYMNDS